jgi:hypothetical protein
VLACSEKSVQNKMSIFRGIRFQIILVFFIDVKESGPDFGSTGQGCIMA